MIVDRLMRSVPVAMQIEQARRATLARPTRCLRGALLALALASSACAGPPSLISASPNPVPRGEENGRTVISWRTDGRGVGFVYVVNPDGSEVLFAAGDQGHEDAPWIDASRPFAFRLYLTGHVGPIGSVTVTRHGDINAALVATLWVLPFLALGAYASRRWAVELAPVALVCWALWLKWIVLGSLVAPWLPGPRWALLCTLSVLVAVCAPLLLVSRRFRLPMAMGLDAFLTFALLADVLYFRYFGSVLTLSAAVAGGDTLHGIIPSVRALLHWADAFYVADLGLVALVVPFYVAWYQSTPAVRFTPRALVAMTIVIAAMGTSTSFIASASPLSGMAAGNRPGSRLYIVADIGLLPFHAFDLATRWTYPALTSPQIDAGDRADAAAYLADRETRERAPSPLSGVAAGRNLIVVMVEALAAFPVGLQIEGRDVTPNLNAFAGQSLAFSRFFDQTYQGGTSDGEFLSMDSLLPLPAGAVPTRMPNHRFHALPAILHGHGYATLSGVGAAGGTWNIREMHPALGFEHSFFDDPSRPAERIYDWLSDDALFAQMLPRLASTRQPFMAYILTSSTHFPFQLPAKFVDLPVGDLRGTQLGGYLQSLHYADAAFGRFLDGLRRRGLLDSSVIAVYGDHRPFFETLEDFNRVMHVPAVDGVDRWIARARLPFFVRLPSGQARGVYATPGGHLDIAPTLLSLLGIGSASEVMLGTDLTREARLGSSVVFRDGSFLNASVLFRRGPRVGQPDTCYRMPGGAPTDCEPFKGEGMAARRMLDVSDSIMFGDLIPSMEVRLHLPASGATSSDLPHSP